MSLEIYGLDLRPSKKMLVTGINLVIDKPNLMVYVLDENGLVVEGATVNVVSSGHNLSDTTDAFGTALLRFMPGIINTLTISKEAYATATVTINQESSSLINIYVNLYPSELRLKVVNRLHEPIAGATCRVLNADSNNVLSFDGVDDYVNMGNTLDLGLNDLTMSMWVYPTKTQVQYTGIIGKPFYGALNGRYALYFETLNRVSFMIQSTAGGFNLNCPESIPTNQWTHITAVLDRDVNAKIYYNGVLKATSANVNSSAVNLTVAKNFTIGTYDGGNRFFGGKMSDARFYYKALAQQEVVDLMNVRLKGDEAGLAGYWKLDEGAGAIATDSAGTNNGTIYGATWQQVGEDFPIKGDFAGFDTTTPYDQKTTNANGLTTLNYQIDKIHGLEVTLPGKRRFIMPFERTTRGLLDWQVMLSDYLATFATDKGNILINSQPENNDSNFLISQ